MIPGMNWPEDPLERVLNCRCINLPVVDVFAPVTVRPTARVDRDVKDVSHEWRMRAQIKAFVIDAGPPRRKP